MSHPLKLLMALNLIQQELIPDWQRNFNPISISTPSIHEITVDDLNKTNSSDSENNSSKTEINCSTSKTSKFSSSTELGVEPLFYDRFRLPSLGEFDESNFQQTTSNEDIPRFYENVEEWVRTNGLNTESEITSNEEEFNIPLSQISANFNELPSIPSVLRNYYPKQEETDMDQYLNNINRHVVRGLKQEKEIEQDLLSLFNNSIWNESDDDGYSADESLISSFEDEDLYYFKTDDEGEEQENDCNICFSKNCPCGRNKTIII